MKITLIRHGKTSGNSQKRFIGRTDENLCDEGIELIKKNVSLKKYPEAELLFVSPMKRCIETAELIYPTLEQIKIEEFREMNFGDFENKNHRELNGNPLYQKWLDSFCEEKCPGGESKAEFTKRVVAGFKEMIFLCNGKNAVAVVHGGTIMSVLSEFYGGRYYDYMTENGGGYTFDLSIKNEELKIDNLEKL